MKPCALVVLALVGLSSGQSSSGDRQVRLDDIERDNLKSPQQTPQQPRPQSYATQQYATQQYSTQPYAQYQQHLVQYTPQYYNIPAAGPSAPSTQLFAQPSLTPGQLSGYHQQLLFAGPQQISQPVLIPQHQALPFPVMLIPSSYLLQQDVNSLLYGGGAAKYAAPSAQQIPASPSKAFRPSPQIGSYSTSQYTPGSSLVQYQNPQQYNAYQTVYQQKFASGAKSTVSPPLKDNYVGQSSNSNVYSSYKIQ